MQVNIKEGPGKVVITRVVKVKKKKDKGKGIMVDDIGTIHVKWDKGSCLGVVFDEDSCRKITE